MLENSVLVIPLQCRKRNPWEHYDAPMPHLGREHDTHPHLSLTHRIPQEKNRLKTTRLRVLINRVNAICPCHKNCTQKPCPHIFSVRITTPENSDDCNPPWVCRHNLRCIVMALGFTVYLAAIAWSIQRSYRLSNFQPKNSFDSIFWRPWSPCGTPLQGWDSECGARVPIMACFAHHTSARHVTLSECSSHEYHPTPPHQAPWSWDPKELFRLQTKKT